MNSSKHLQQLLLSGLLASSLFSIAQAGDISYEVSGNASTTLYNASTGAVLATASTPGTVSVSFDTPTPTPDPDPAPAPDQGTNDYNTNETGTPVFTVKSSDFPGTAIRGISSYTYKVIWTPSSETDAAPSSATITFDPAIAVDATGTGSCQILDASGGVVQTIDSTEAQGLDAQIYLDGAASPQTKTASGTFTAQADGTYAAYVTINTNGIVADPGASGTANVSLQFDPSNIALSFDSGGGLVLPPSPLAKLLLLGLTGILGLGVVAIKKPRGLGKAAFIGLLGIALTTASRASGDGRQYSFKYLGSTIQIIEASGEIPASNAWLKKAPNSTATESNFKIEVNKQFTCSDFLAAENATHAGRIRYRVVYTWQVEWRKDSSPKHNFWGNPQIELVPRLKITSKSQIKSYNPNPAVGYASATNNLVNNVQWESIYQINKNAMLNQVTQNSQVTTSTKGTQTFDSNSKFITVTMSDVGTDGKIKRGTFSVAVYVDSSFNLFFQQSKGTAVTYSYIEPRVKVKLNQPKT